MIGDGIHKAQTRIAQDLLDKVKRERYGGGKKYELVKVKDHPLTFKEVEVSRDKKVL